LNIATKYVDKFSKEATVEIGRIQNRHFRKSGQVIKDISNATLLLQNIAEKIAANMNSKKESFTKGNPDDENTKVIFLNRNVF